MGEWDFSPPGTLARPEEIRHSANGLRAITGVLLGHGDNVGAVLGEVALSFSEVISAAVAVQISSNIAALEAAVEGTEYGYAVGCAWADEVGAFIDARNQLMAGWEAAERDDFGVPFPDGGPQLPSESSVSRREAVEAARRDALGGYTAEGMLLWERFQDQVREKGRMFREGPTAANLAVLVAQLGWGAMTLWPEIATTPVLGAADGNAAARDVLAGLDGQASPEEVAEALATIAMIVTRAAHGHELTEAELDYLEAFYDTMGVRILELPDYLASTSGPIMYDADAPPGPAPPMPFDGSPELVATLTAAAANGLLVLSRPGPNTCESYSRLPSWLRDTVDRESTDPYADFERLTELGDLLSHSTIEAGDELSRELALSVEWMIDYADSREDPLINSGVPDLLRADIAPSAPGLLDVVSRNDEVCADLLSGDGMPADYSPEDYFIALYTFDWTADDGAAAAGLTDFIPEWAASEDPVLVAQAEAAMFDLVQIVTSDDGFTALMDGVGTSGVAAESAVGQVNPAITDGFVVAMASCMDSFAGPQIEGADPTGLDELSFETRVRFTTLICTDPGSAQALVGASYTYEQQELYEYAVSGDAEAHGGDVGRIRGIVDAGLINAELDAGADLAEAEAAAARSRQLGIDIAAGLASAIPIPGLATLVDISVAIIDYQDSSGVSAAAGDSPSPARTEDERRLDTVSTVMAGLVTSGQIPQSAVPAPFIGPVQDAPTVEDATDDLLHAAAAYGFDLTAILARIHSAYSDLALVGERDG